MVWRLSVLLLLVLTATAALGLYFFPTDILKDQIIAAVKAETGFDCTIDNIEADVLAGRFTAHRIEITHRDSMVKTPLVSAQNVALEVALGSLPGMLLKRPPQINHVSIEEGLLNLELLTIGRPAEPSTAQPAASAPTDSAADSAPAPATPEREPEAADAQKAIQKYAGAMLDIRKISLRNISCFGRDCDPERPPLTITAGTIKLTGEAEYSFAFEVESLSGGTGTLGGNASNVHFPDFTQAKLTGALNLNNFDVLDIFHLNGVPQAEGWFRLPQARAALDITYEAGVSGISGQISAPELRIVDFSPFKSPDCTLTLRHNVRTNHLNLQELRITAAGGYVLQGSAELTPQKDYLHLSADIRESNLPSTLLLEIIGEEEISPYINGGVRISGQLGNRDNLWLFAGNCAADGIALPFVLSAKLGRIAAGVVCSQEQRRLELRDIDADLQLLTLRGSALLPLGEQPNMQDFAISLRGGIDGAFLPDLPGVEKLTARLEWELQSAVTPEGMATFGFRLNNLPGEAVKLEVTGLPLTFDCADLRCKLDGGYRISDRELAISAGLLRLDDSGIQFALTHNPQGLNASYGGKLAIPPLLPLAELFLHEYYRSIEKVRELSLQGHFAISAGGETLRLQLQKLSAALSDDRLLSLKGELESTPQSGKLATRNISLTLAAQEKTLLQGSGELLLNSPEDNTLAAEFVLSGGVAALANLLQDLEITPQFAGSGGAFALRGNYRHAQKLHTLNLALNANAPSVVHAATPYLAAESLSAQIAASYNPTEGELELKNLRLRINDNAVVTTAAGRLRPLGGLSGDFHLAQEADLQTLARCLPAFFTAAPDLSARLKTELTLQGTLEHPVLDISASAPDLVFTGSEGEAIRIESPALSGKLKWRQANQRIEDLALETLRLSSAGQTLEARGRAQRLLLKDGEIDFGGNGEFAFLLRGKRKMLGWFMPSLSSLAADAGEGTDAIELSGILRVPTLPLPPLSEADRMGLLRTARLSHGKLRIDELRSPHARLRNILAEITLEDGRLNVTRGSLDFGGPIQFDLLVDYNTTPASAQAGASGLNLSLLECLSAQAIDSSITGGLLSFPWPMDKGSIRARWRGTDIESLRQTLEVEPTGLHIEDLRMVMTLFKPDFVKVFSYDMPESLAQEAARRMDEKFREQFSTPTEFHYHDIDINFSVSEGCLILTNCAVSGGNAADLVCSGRIWLDGRIDLTIKPVRHIANSFNIAAMLEESVFQSFLRNLEGEQRQKAMALVPQWLEETAARGGIIIRLTGTLDDPEIDPKTLRDCIRAELPGLVSRIGSSFNERDLLQGILGKDAVKELDNVLKEINNR